MIEVETGEMLGRQGTGAAANEPASSNLLGAAWMTPRRQVTLVATLACLAYVGSLGGDFVYDDDFGVSENVVVRGEVPFHQAFVRDFWGYPPPMGTASYRPWPVLSHAIDWSLGKGDPFPHHLSNVLLHMLVAVLLSLVGSRLFSPSIGLVAAVLFTSFAAWAEAVHALVGRADLLTTAAFLGGLMVQRRKGWGHGVGAVALFALAIGSKETGIVVPLAWLATDILVSGAAPVRHRLGRWGGYGLVTAAYIAARGHALGDSLRTTVDPFRNPLHLSNGWIEQALGASRVLVERYLRGIADPTWRAFDCSAPACNHVATDDLLGWIGLTLVVAVLVCVVALVRRATAVATGLAWCVILFAPVSNMIVLGPTIYGERLLYLPATGLCLAMAGAVGLVADRLGGWRFASGLVVAMAIPQLVGLQLRHQEWKTTLSLVEADLRRLPNNAFGHYKIAAAYVKVRRPADGERAVRRALELRPSFPEAREVLGAAVMLQGREEEAEAILADSIRRGSPSSQAVKDYATLLARRGAFTEALATVQRHQARLGNDERLAKVAEKLERAIASQRARAR